MSKRVIIICALLFLLGIAGAVDMVSQLTQSKIRFNVLALFFPASICLFLGGARAITSTVFALCYLFLTLFIIAPLAIPSGFHISVGTHHLPIQNPFLVILVFASMVGATLAMIHRIIYSPPFDEHLGQ